MIKNKIRLTGFVTRVIIVLSALLLTTITASAAPNVKLPTTPVQATYTWDQNGLQFTSVVLNGVGSGFDVKDNTPYIGWCVERLSGPDPMGKTFSVNLYSSYDPNLPVNLTKWGTRTIPWDQINYALNHRQGVSTSEVAGTIWDLVEGTFSSIPLEQDALANGTGFVPGNGQVVAVIMTNGSGINSVGDIWQENIIEVTLSTTTAVSLSSFSADVSGNEMVPAGLVIPVLGVSLLGIAAVLGIWKLGLRRA